ncbi:hypothetical protein D3C81_1190480 [compost metagenome]
MGKEFSNKEHGLTKEDFAKYLNKQEAGFEEAIGCPVCEGLEIHVKQENGKWRCKNCGAE